MPRLEQTKSCCWFYKSSSGTAQAGGCTKVFLDAHHGDVSRVMGANGQPKQNTTASVVNDFASRTANLNAAGLGTGVLPGLIARIVAYFYEVVGVASNSIQLDRWVGQSDGVSVATTGTHSRVYPDDSSLYAVGGAVHVIHTTGGAADGTYTILSIAGGALEIADSQSVYNHNPGTISIAPAVIPSGLTVVIGGAYNDLQTVLNASTAIYQDQWIFLNEELAPSAVTGGAAWTIYSTSSGEGANNTKLYIVGFKTYAYDGLPEGFGYFPSGTQNIGTHYKTPLERAKNYQDASLKADLMTASCKNLPGAWDRLFRLSANSENVQFMGLYFEVTTTQWPILADNASTGSVFVKHCAGGHTGFDAAPAYYGGQIVRVQNTATGGGIVDSFFKGVDLFDGTNPTVDRSGDWEFAYNVGIHTGNINPEYSGPIVHHNLFVRSTFGAAVVARSYQNVWNNIFYLCKKAAFNLNGAEGRLRAWNNIIVMDETDALFEGALRVAAGGTVDTLDYNCYCNQNGQPVSVFAFPVGTNPNFNIQTLIQGPHDIETDPMFIDPANWDFRLRPDSPCIGAGRPDLEGRPTHIGAFVPEESGGGLYRPLSRRF